MKGGSDAAPRPASPGRGDPHGPGEESHGENSEKLFGERSIRKVFETLAKTPTQNSLFCKAKVLVSQFWDASNFGEKAAVSEGSCGALGSSIGER